MSGGATVLPTNVKTPSNRPSLEKHVLVDSQIRSKNSNSLDDNNVQHKNNGSKLVSSNNYRDMKGRVRNLKNISKQIMERKKQYRVKLEEANLWNDSLSDQVSNFKTKVLNLESQLVDNGTDTMNKMTNATNELAAQIESWKDKCDNLQKLTNSLTEQVKKQKSKIYIYENEKKQLSNKNEQLNQQINNQKLELESLKTTLMLCIKWNGTSSQCCKHYQKKC